jgi:hypothetical protein
MNLQSLNQKWHGVPIWAWAAIVAVVGFFAYRYMKNRGSGGSSASSPLAHRINQQPTEVA